MSPGYAMPPPEAWYCKCCGEVQRVGSFMEIGTCQTFGCSSTEWQSWPIGTVRPLIWREASAPSVATFVPRSLPLNITAPPGLGGNFGGVVIAERRE